MKVALESFLMAESRVQILTQFHSIIPRGP